MIKAKLTGTSGVINSQLDSNEQQLEVSLEKSTPQYVGGNGIDIDNGVISNIGVTSINGQTGDLDGFALTAEIPTKTSQLENNSNYANVNQIPTKTSQLVNDSNYAISDEIPTDYYTQEEVNTLISNVTVDLSDYYTKIESDDKFADKSDVPTKTSQLTNDSQFITNTVSNLTNYYKKTETYTQAEVNNLIGSITTISFQVVDNLTSTGEANIIYLVSDAQSTNNVYDEYIWVNNSWELIGSTSVDLSKYYTKTEADNKFALSANLADVATSGSYNDLSDKPTIPSVITIDSSLSSTSTNPVQNKVVNNALDEKLSLSGGTLKGNINGGVIDTHPDNKGTLLSYYINDLFGLLQRGGTCTITNKTTNTTITPSDELFDATPSYFYFKVNAVTDIVEILIDISNCNPNYYTYGTQFGIGCGASNWRAKDVKIEVGFVGVINEVTYNAWKTVLNVTNSNNRIHNISSSGPGVNEGGLSNNRWNNLKITLTNFNNTSPRIAQIWTQNYGSKGLAKAFVQYTGGTFIGNVNGITPSNDDDSTKFATTEFVKNQEYAKSIDLPTKTSDLTNDSNFATTSDIPTKTSDLENDSDYLKAVDTKQIKINNGSASGCLRIGANVSSTILTSGIRKLARLTFPTYSSDGTGLDCAFVSCDTKSNLSEAVKNLVEFGSRTGDITCTSPDEISFTVANVHDSTTDKKTIAIYKSSGVYFYSQPYYNTDALALKKNIPTKTSDLTNDSDYQTATQVATATAYATETTKGTVRIWTTIEDGKIVLNIATEDAS